METFARRDKRVATLELRTSNDQKVPNCDSKVEVSTMVEKMKLDGLPEDTPLPAIIDKASAAKNMMSRIRGYSPSQWVLAISN